MKKIASLLLVFVLTMSFVTCCADGNSDLKLGMSEEDAISVMGGTGTVDQILTSFAGILKTHLYENQKISMYDDALLNIAFMDGKLIAKLYGFYPDTLGNHYEYLFKALQQKYGEHGEEYDFASQMLELYGAGSIIEEVGIEYALSLYNAKISTWTADDGSHITLLYMTNNNEEMTILSYVSSLDDVQVVYNDSGL